MGQETQATTLRMAWLGEGVAKRRGPEDAGSVPNCRHPAAGWAGGHTMTADALNFPSRSTLAWSKAAALLLPPPPAPRVKLLPSLPASAPAELPQCPAMVHFTLLLQRLI